MLQTCDSECFSFLVNRIIHKHYNMQEPFRIWKMSWPVQSES